MPTKEQAAQADPHALAIARAVQEAIAPEATVILFGSRATGRHRPDSDVDLMVLTDALDPHIAAQDAAVAARRYMEQNPPWLAVNPVGFTWRDFQHYSRAGLHVTGQAARFGVFMSSAGLERSGHYDSEPETDYPAHWPATSQRIRNVLRHRNDLNFLAQHSEPSLELFGRVVQQAVENALKGWLSAYNLQRDFGHNLLELWNAIREVEDYATESAGLAMAKTRTLFDHIEFQDDDRPADWLTRYAIVYQYHEVSLAINREHLQELVETVNQALDAIVGHIYQRSGVAPEDPQSLTR